MPKGVETITRVRKPKLDKLKPQDSAAPDEQDFGQCATLPRQPIETEQGLVGVEGIDVFCFDPACDVTRNDQVRYNGVLYNVEGEPRTFLKLGKFKTLQITLTKVS